MEEVQESVSIIILSYVAHEDLRCRKAGPVSEYHVMSFTILPLPWMFLAAARRRLWTPTRCIRVQQCIRYISILRIDPSVREFMSNLAQRHPKFSVSPTSISVLCEPPQFYALLLVRFVFTASQFKF